MRFYNREKELDLLRSLKKGFRVAVIGRRRIGKTRLVEEAYKDSLMFFVSAEKTEKEIINGWCSEYEQNLPKVETFSEFFRFIFTHYKNKIIFIDEFQNFWKVKKSFLYDLQRLIDKHKPSLVTTGSIISTMKKIIQDEKQPLYGRFDYVIKLKELSFETICEMCKDLKLKFEDAIKLYAVFGGIPKYYELIEKVKRFEFYEFVIKHFVEYPRPLYEEAKIMLKEEFGKEYKTFFSILSAIARGKNRHSEIAGFLGKKESQISKYIKMLKDEFEIISHKYPVLGTKRGIYEIKNNFFNFWFGLIWRYNYLLEWDEERRLANIVRKNIDKYIGLMFEKIIEELIRSEKITFDVKSNFTKIGRQWGKIPKAEKGRNTYEIDILALDEKHKKALVCECKWKSKINAEKVVKELEEKVRYVKGLEGYKIEYAIFGKSFSKKVGSFKDRKVYCFGLKELWKVLRKQ